MNAPSTRAKWLYLALLGLALLMPGASSGVAQPHPANLTGQLLVATPAMTDPRFRRTVIYMVRHNADGALGIIVNRRLGDGDLADLMKGFGLDPSKASGRISLHFGGPVKPSAVFVLHTSDYADGKSETTAADISLTTDVKVLEAIAAKRGPSRYLVALGYSGWGPGQLERELKTTNWLTVTATPDLVFGDRLGDVWDRLGGQSGKPL